MDAQLCDRDGQRDRGAECAHYPRDTVGYSRRHPMSKQRCRERALEKQLFL